VTEDNPQGDHVRSQVTKAYPPTRMQERRWLGEYVLSLEYLTKIRNDETSAS